MFSSTTPYLERNVPIEGFEDLADRLFHAFVPPFAPSQPPRACPANVPDFSQSDGSPPMCSLSQSPLCRPTQPRASPPTYPSANAPTIPGIAAHPPSTRYSAGQNEAMHPPRDLALHFQILRLSPADADVRAAFFDECATGHLVIDPGRR